MQVRSPGQEDPLEKDMAAHSGILAWRIPWTEEPGRLQSMGLQSQTRLKWLSAYACTDRKYRLHCVIQTAYPGQYINKQAFLTQWLFPFLFPLIIFDLFVVKIP